MIAIDSNYLKSKDSILFDKLIIDPFIPDQTVGLDILLDSTYREQNHLTQEVEINKIFFEGKPIRNFQESWISGLILICFILIAYVNFNHRRRFSQLIRATFAKNYMNQLIREGNLFKERFSLILLINYALIIPLFIYFSIDLLFPFKGLAKSTQIFGYLVLISLGIWLFKVLIIKLNGLIFKTPKPTYEILLYIYLNNIVLSLITLPLISIYFFTQIKLFLFLCLGIFILIYILRIIREFMIGLSFSIFSVLHLFLYLCSLEIIPAVILIKIITIYYR